MMKQFKLTLIALVALLTVGSLSAQDSNNPWSIGLGFNAIDFKANDNIVKDFLGHNDTNISQFFSRLSVERSFNHGFSVEAVVSLNQITHFMSKGDVKAQYYGFDLNAKYDLNELFGETGWFDPYVVAGFGYSQIDAATDIDGTTFNYGAGFNFWISEKIGINVQSLAKSAFGNELEDFFQHSLGIVFKFGTSQEK